MIKPPNLYSQIDPHRQLYPHRTKWKTDQTATNLSNFNDQKKRKSKISQSKWEKKIEAIDINISLSR